MRVREKKFDYPIIIIIISTVESRDFKSITCIFKGMKSWLPILGIFSDDVAERNEKHLTHPGQTAWHECEEQHLWRRKYLFRKTLSWGRSAESVPAKNMPWGPLPTASSRFWDHRRTEVRWGWWWVCGCVSTLYSYDRLLLSHSRQLYTCTCECRIVRLF